MEILYLCVFSIISIILIFFAFITGLKYGSKIKKEESINIPNPIKVVKEIKNNKEIEKKLEKEQQIEEINLANIDAYDGTALGQKSFPEE